jgi:hypothetical protein
MPNGDIVLVCIAVTNWLVIVIDGRQWRAEMLDNGR